MLINYLKIAIRSSLKNGTTSIVNFLGLTVGIVSSLLIFLYVNHEISYDRFHKKADRIFKVLSIDEALGVNNNIVGITIPALAPGMKSEIAGVENIVRINGAGKTLVKYGDNTLYTERLIYTDPSFFEVFDFELAKGDPKTCLEKPFSALLTETMAKKVFRDEDPIGKIFSADGSDNLEVTGILKDPDKPSHIEYEMIISINPSPSDSNSIAYLNSWQNISQLQYVLLEDANKKEEIIVEMDSLLRRHDAPDFWKATLQPFKEIHLYSNNVLFDGLNREKGDIKYIKSLSLIAIIILLIAGFNYMNLSTARSAKRAREVGIRKTAGANRGKLILQHLSEAILQVFVALVVSLAVIELINGYYHVINTSIFRYFMNDPKSIIYLAALVITLGVLSGIYPAMILSGYKPQIVLKGKFETGKKGLWLRRFLVTIQFVATFIMIVGIIVVVTQLRYTLSKDKGFNDSQIVNILLDNQEVRDNYDALKMEFEKISGIKMIANSGSMPGLGFGRTGIQPEGSNEEDNWIVSVMSMDENYIPLMDMKIIEGENFRKDMSNEPLPIIVNESLIKAVGWESGLNKSLALGQTETQIVGIVKDFHFTSMRHQIEPIMMIYRAGSSRVLSVKVNENNIKETLEEMKKVWGSINIGIPFEYNFYDESFRNLFEKEEDFSRMFFRFTLLSVFVAILGLFGLAAFSAEQRTKEIGVRKTFGATTKQMILLQSHEYLRLVLIAIILASPIAYFLVRGWLQDFIYRINLGFIPFIIAAFIILFVTIITVSIQSFKAARRNPAETLKYE